MGCSRRHRHHPRLLHWLVAAVEGGCRASLERLRVSYLDLYLMHAPFRRADGRPFAASLPQLWAAMERLVDGGLVRRIGVSNWCRADLDAVMGNCTSSFRRLWGGLGIEDAATLETCVQVCRYAI